MVIVSATLVDPWQDLAGIGPGPRLREEVSAFVQEWEAGHTLRPGYQLSVGRLRAFLGELSRWLGQVEAASGTAERDASPQVQREFTLEVEASLADKLAELFGEFETEASQVPPPEAASHKAFARREVHPLTLASPFIHRTFTKPLGYAGDYEMVNMILRDPLEGENTYARVLNSVFLRRDAPQAHRNRIDRLVECLQAEARRAAGRGRRLRVLNVGCGPAGEVQRLIRDDPLSDRCELHLMDFNPETLDHARHRLTEAARESGRSPAIHYHHKSVNELLREATRHAHGRERVAPFVEADLIYCAGLFDYLTDKVCSRLLQMFYAWAVPGGLVVATNVHPNNRSRYFMEHLLDWYLIYRDEGHMCGLAPEAGEKTVYTEATGVNVFLEIRKPSAGN
jgi:extracellular factor (EF) 3-hydroxypalmitic acid methyl ester biosynthesis protein